MTNGQGNVVWTGSSLPFGEEFSGTGTRDTEIRYAGKSYNDALGLYDFGGRYYDPSTGRFTGVDPVKGDISNPQRLNAYSYGLNSPYKYVDPDGGDPQEIYTLTAAGVPFGGYGALVGLGIGIGLYAYERYQNDPEFQAAVQSAVKDVGNIINPKTSSTVTDGLKTGTKDNVLETSNKKLREAWERENKQPWPKDPSTGKNQDVSHEKPKADGGTDSLDNIKPRPRQEHIDLHKKSGDFKRWGKRGGDKINE